MLRWLFPGLALVLCLQASVASAETCPKGVRIGFQDTDSPPMLMGQGERFSDPPGWQVVAVRDVLRRLGCTAELVRLPSRRLSAALAQGQVDLALFFGVTPERLRAMRFPLDAQGRPDQAWAPMFGRLVLFARAGTPPSSAWDGRELPPNWRVGAVAGTVQEALARERGWALESISAVDFGLQMLQARRFDLLLASREALSPEQRAGLVDWGTAARIPVFAPASAEFAQRHPAWTRTFWSEFCVAVRRVEPSARPVDCGQQPVLPVSPRGVAAQP